MYRTKHHVYWDSMLPRVSGNHRGSYYEYLLLTRPRYVGEGDRRTLVLDKNRFFSSSEGTLELLTNTVWERTQ